MSEHETERQRPDSNHKPVTHQQSPQPQAKLAGEPLHQPPAGKAPNGAGGATRATQLEPVRDVGEHVVGSAHTEAIHMPWNLGDHNASARFRVSGAAFELLSPAGEVRIPPSKTMKGAAVGFAERASPKIQFGPGHAGTYKGELIVEIRWDDGHFETQTVALHGRARTLAQAPAAYEPAAAPAQPQAQPPPRLDLKDPKARAIDRASSAEVTKVNAEVVNAAGALAGFQQLGVEIVKNEQATYQKPLAKLPRSILWDLVEVALTVGTAGAAAVVAKTLLPKVIAKLSENSGEAAKLGEFATDSIKEGLKMAGKAALKDELPHDRNTGAKSPPGEGEGETLSSNPRIEFFAKQESVLVTQEQNNKDMVAAFAASLQPLVARHPDHAVTLLKALTTSFGAAKKDATQTQAQATSTQWATAVARATLGSERVATSQSAPGSAPLTAVKTDSLRPASNGGNPAPVAGVLDVYVECVSPRNGEWKIVGAKLHGVAQEIADRLNKSDLSDARLPVRFIVRSFQLDKPILITRDEAGRVRITEDLTYGERPEEQSIAAAEAFVHRMLSASIHSWGVEIQSDDTSGRK